MKYKRDKVVDAVEIPGANPAVVGGKKHQQRPKMSKGGW